MSFLIAHLSSDTNRYIAAFITDNIISKQLATINITNKPKI